MATFDEDLLAEEGNNNGNDNKGDGYVDESSSDNEEMKNILLLFW